MNYEDVTRPDGPVLHNGTLVYNAIIKPLKQQFAEGDNSIHRKLIG